MNGNSVHIGLTGDVMIGRNVNTSISSFGYAYPWGNVLPLLKKTDVNIINLEAALTNSNKKVFKTFNFKATPDRTSTLTAGCITLVNLANNHILDFSEEGLVESIHSLIGAGINYVGAGRNAFEAERPCILRKNDTSIGVLGFTDNEPGWAATPSGTGVNYIDISNGNDRARAKDCISALCKRADIVIVSIHWGPNMKLSPDQEFVNFAHEMIDSGADIIHGHSAHNFQGIEVYRNKLVLYDTGDFIDDYMVNPDFKNDHSFLFRIEVNKEGIKKLELFPVLISDCQVNLAAMEDYQWSATRIQELSAGFGTTLIDKGEVIVKYF
ncbi:CapA family protein [Flavihumibacter fluvii]|uniref:CapA family protein n=1 Tax=Flavihumibacter fluvii TaxID=2838157 RepID=UPI001BDDE77A|nr:CapA family protein [Flavihumibacter fluvii]ULQ51629.1 CapA family protein [Flavihumibacter fluvii]